MAPLARPPLHAPLGPQAGARRPFIVDLLIPEHRLVIEADGMGHGSLRDVKRDKWLAAQGFRVLRPANRDVLTNLSGCLDAIAAQTPQH